VLLMMDAKGVRNMQSILVVVNKHNTARVASCWFIIYYRLMMHGNSNIKSLFEYPDCPWGPQSLFAVVLWTLPQW